MRSAINSGLRLSSTDQSQENGSITEPVPLPRWAIPALIAAGIACRLLQYFYDRSFWVDEASLVLNIRGKTAAQLLGPLDFHQAAPPLFLLAEHAIFRLLGGSELSLRLLPILAGCASVFLFASLASKLLEPWAAAIAVALFCFSDRLIWHADEVKQYGIDVFFTVALLRIAVGLIYDERRPYWRLICFMAVTVIAVWCSYASVFVFAGCSLLMLKRYLRRGLRGMLAYGAMNLLVLLSFALMLRVVLKSQDTHYMQRYWSEHFVPVHHPSNIAGWLVRRLVAFCNYPTVNGSIGIIPCAIAGAFWLGAKRRYRTLALLLLPAGFHLLAAFLQRYPFDGARLTVYLTVPLAMLAGAGTLAFYQWLAPNVGRLAIAPALITLAIPAWSAAVHLVVPRQRGDVRGAAAFVSRNARPEDGVYVLQLSEFAAYWRGKPANAREAFVPADEIPFERFWIVWSYPDPAALHRFDRVRAWARTFAVEQNQSYVGRNNCAYLYQMKPGDRPDTLPPNFRQEHPGLGKADG